MTVAAVDRLALEAKVKEMYTAVADNPHGAFHFEMGRGLAERLGYDAALLDRVPEGAIDSFAGVGHFFHLAELQHGERVVDLGSGSGMDTFVAALLVGPTGHVIGVDMTDAQRHKATRLADAAGVAHLTYRRAYIEETGLESGSVDCVMSNGVINLAPDKSRVFQEAARVLKRGGRLAIADIVAERALPDTVVCNADLWAACIGGAAQTDAYRSAIEAAGLRVEAFEQNTAYAFTSNSAKSATTQFGVKSVSILARKP